MSPLPEKITKRYVSKPIVFMLLIFVAAFGIRMYHINDAFLEFHPARQHHGALIARAYFYNWSDSVPSWKKRVASANKKIETIIEPPIMQIITAYIYQMLGKEAFWVPRILSCIFWLIGGIYLFI